MKLLYLLAFLLVVIVACNGLTTIRRKSPQSMTPFIRYQPAEISGRGRSNFPVAPLMVNAASSPLRTVRTAVSEPSQQQGRLFWNLFNWGGNQYDDYPPYGTYPPPSPPRPYPGTYQPPIVHPADEICVTEPDPITYELIEYCTPMYN